VSETEIRAADVRVGDKIESTGIVGTVKLAEPEDDKIRIVIEPEDGGYVTHRRDPDQTVKLVGRG